METEYTDDPLEQTPGNAPDEATRREAGENPAESPPGDAPGADAGEPSAGEGGEERAEDKDAGAQGAADDEPQASESASALSDEEREEIRSVVEAILFAAQEPLSAPRIAACIPGVDGRTVRSMLFELRERYARENRGFELEEVAGGFRLYTRPEYHVYVERLFRQRQGVRLSPAAIETLAIVAYKQPITRAEIEDIRGVAVGPVLRTLMDFGLLRIVGRKEVLGRPLLYGTSKKFLEHFGLKGIKDLPKIEEFHAAARDKGLAEVEPGDIQSVALETAAETSEISPDGSELSDRGDDL